MYFYLLFIYLFNFFDLYRHFDFEVKNRDPFAGCADLKT